MGARVVPTELAVGKAHERLDQPEPALRDQLRALGHDLLAAAEPQPIAA